VRDWQGLGFDEATLARLFHDNAARLFPGLAA
jgi:hypothetical protein